MGHEAVPSGIMKIRVGEQTEAEARLVLSVDGARRLAMSLKEWLGDRTEFVRQDPLVLPGDEAPVVLKGSRELIALTPREALDMMQALAELLEEHAVDPPAHQHVYSDDYQTWVTVSITEQTELASDDPVLVACDEPDRLNQ
jgi:hypothetical protein